MKNNFSIIISNNPRSLLYLKYLKKNNLIPEDIIYLNKNIKNFVAKKLRLKKFFFPRKKITVFNTFNIYEDIYKFLKIKKVKNIVYSGYSGNVIKHSKILKFGVAFDEQEIKKVPTMSFDKKMDLVLTPTKIII